MSDKNHSTIYVRPVPDNEEYASVELVCVDPIHEDALFVISADDDELRLDEIKTLVKQHRETTH